MSRHVRSFEAVAFDLLTALIDSWSLWALVAGSQELGRAWGTASLRLVTSAGTYRPYEQIVHQAGRDVGLAAERADELLARWGELRPWPDVPDALAGLRSWRLGVVTNCSQRLAEIAASATGGRFDVIMSAEQAGAYKTDPRAYLAGLAALALPPERVLFVAGSPHDVPGAAAVGMAVYWANRLGLPPTDGPGPLVEAPDLSRLSDLLR